MDQNDLLREIDIDADLQNQDKQTVVQLIRML